MRSSGTLLCLASATAFGAMGVFGKLAYADGATVGTLLAARFVIAAAVFWLVALAGTGIAELRSLPARDVALGLALGACVYAAQAGGYFAALDRIDASLLSLLVYTFPAMVTVAAIALGRERVDHRRTAALALASVGLLLILAGAGTGALDPIGTALGLGAAVVYSAYMFAGESIGARVRPQLLAALVCTGAALSITAAAMLLGDLHAGDVTLAGWTWLVCLAVVSTVGAVGLFFAGLRLVGATTAAIISTAEPLVTVLLAFVVFGEVLGPVQLAGGALILAAVLALQISTPGGST